MRSRPCSTYGEQDESARVRSEAALRAKAVLPFEDPASARRYLNSEENRTKTYIALVLEQSGKQGAENEELRAERNEYLQKFLEREPPGEAFAVLVEGDADKRRIAAERIHAFAKDWKLTNSAAKQFAEQATVAWVRESERKLLEASVLAPLTSTLTLLADQKHGEVLWQVPGFKDALADQGAAFAHARRRGANRRQTAPGLCAPAQWGTATAGADGQVPRGRPGNEERRRAAVVALGNLTSNDSLDVGPTSRAYWPPSKTPNCRASC